MTARDLVRYPDARLKTRVQPVTVWDAGLRTLADDLLDTLKAVSALGLTAPHIGVPLRVVVIRLQPDLQHTIYVNPEIVGMSEERAPQTEGSVSMPGISEPIDRASQVRVRYRDLVGVTHEREADGFLAACLQHEIDQLDGIFWIDRLSRLRRDRAIKRYARLQRATP